MEHGFPSLLLPSYRILATGQPLCAHAEGVADLQNSGERLSP